ncbi:MAG: DUF5615 family PIN-like protein [Candidatus Binatia bacterium]
MRFLADESCDFAVVRALRAAGHDVVAIVEASPAAEDPVVLDFATRDQRILLTEDKDFGRLVHAHSRGAVGVLFVRFPANARARLGESVVELVEQKGDQLIGRFVVVQPGRIRIHRIRGR